MAGGLLNIVSYGNQNVYLNGNPSKTFFKTVYKKYTNFGLQKFRTDFNGLRNLRMNEPSKFTFKMKRYAELLMDTYLVVTLPTIWSPIYPPQDCSGDWVPYEFKWIDNLGTQMIDEVNITVGGQLLNRYTGSYFLALIQRDFTGSKKNLYEYGFNRPIYSSEKAVQSYINSREFQDEHAYIAVVVNKDDASEGQVHLTDSLEQPLVKIKEAALLMDNISYFWHKEEKYSLARDQLVPFDEG